MATNVETLKIGDIWLKFFQLKSNKCDLCSSFENLKLKLLGNSIGLSLGYSSLLIKKTGLHSSWKGATIHAI